MSVFVLGNFFHHPSSAETYTALHSFLIILTFIASGRFGLGATKIAGLMIVDMAFIALCELENGFVAEGFQRFTGRIANLAGNGF